MESTPGAKPLTRKQQIFVERYLATWSGTHAAADAGFAVPHVAYARLLRQPQIKQAIADRVSSLKMEADEVLLRLKQQATLHPAIFYKFGWVQVKDKNGKEVIDPDTNEPAKSYEMVGVNWKNVEKFSYLVKKVSYDRQGRTVLEFHDAQNALMLIGKANRIFIDRLDTTNLNVEVSADELAEARDKAQAFERAFMNGSDSE